MNENEEKGLSETLKDQAEAHNMSASKIAEASGVPERYIAALTRGELSSLPPAPYIRGYLLKMASVLGGDGNEWWLKYKKEIATQSSGPLDRLPINRFAIQSVAKKWVIVTLSAAAFLGLLVFRLPDIIGQPMLQLGSFEEERAYEVASPLLILGGSIKPGDKLTVNGEATYVNPDGSFEKEVLLQKGLNTVELKVARFLGKEKKILRQFIFAPEEKQGTTPGVIN